MTAKLPEKYAFVHEGESGRLDRILTDRFGQYTRSRIQQLIRAGHACVNGARITKTGYKLEGGSNVEFTVPETVPVDLEPEPIPLDVLYEDENLLVINKPAGMVVHPSAGHDSGTLVHAVLHHVSDLEGVGGEKRPGIVHRLDKYTSGIILVAKNDRALHDLQKQFKQRTVAKTYLALTDGVPPTSTGRIEMPIGRDHRNRKRMAVTTPEKGKMAVTMYRIVEQFTKHAMLEIGLETGRTHQVRVHLAYIGAPVAGDTVYGRRKRTIPLKQRFFLHASKISFTLPSTGDNVTLEAPLPPGLENVLAWLRKREPH